MSVEKVDGDSICTPRRVQKCLFGSNGSSRKKKVHKVQKYIKTCDSLSGDESDLGPMSPLELSDHSPSSCTSSPRIPLLSPNITPKRLSLQFNMNASWDQLQQSTNKRADHTRVSLKKAIQAVTHCSRNEILPDSPRSLSNSPSIIAGKHAEMDLDEVVPDTPEREFGKELQNTITETPYKCESPKNKLITPFNTESKTVLLPRVHRRKSLNILSLIENSSPRKKEGSLKRHAFEEVGNTAAKLLKTDENESVPKARAALFQDKDYESKLKTLTLSTKNFYNNSETKKDRSVISELPEPKRQRRSLTGHTSCHRKSLKRHTIGGINAGVSHGIRKPKPKANVNTTKNSNDAQNLNNTQDTIDAHEETQNKVADISSEERSPSPEIDLNKRFFKIKRSSKRKSLAIVKLNNNVKLNFTFNGTFELSKKIDRPIRQAHKRAKLADISFDATDLSVDEPNVEGTIEEDKVANILKVLEDDWAEDDYDSMEILSNARLANISPLKPVAIFNDVTMSPSSELSNMTSTMNIKDIGTPPAFNNPPSDVAEKSDENPSKPKYYPLFSKGYSSNMALR